MNQKKSIGFWKGLVRQFRLSWRLLWDPRVPGWTKLLPFITLAYIISPIDLIPDVALGLGQLDDLGILLLGVRLFTELVPEEILLQHLQKMGADVDQWRVTDEDSSVIDAEYKIRDE
jgi:uncharacterized membrane protein YkvA (DUF1232 family)